MKTAAVINYCSYQKDFIRPLIEELKKFVTGEIVIVSYDKLYNGNVDEPLKHIKGTTNLQLTLEPNKSSRYHQSLQRKSGYDVLKDKYDAVYFLDADEIPYGDLMKEWESTAEIKDYRFLGYWFFRDTCFRARQFEATFALVSVSSLENHCEWFGGNDREDFTKFELWNRDITFNNQLLCDHYSWVGTEEMLLKKASNWTHSGDRNWIEEIKEEFRHEFNGECFFRNNYSFDTIISRLDFKYNG